MQALIISHLVWRSLDAAEPARAAHSEALCTNGYFLLRGTRRSRQGRASCRVVERPADVREHLKPIAIAHGRHNRLDAIPTVLPPQSEPLQTDRCHLTFRKISLLGGRANWLANKTARR